MGFHTRPASLATRFYGYPQWKVRGQKVLCWWSATVRLALAYEACAASGRTFTDTELASRRRRRLSTTRGAPFQHSVGVGLLSSPRKSLHLPPTPLSGCVYLVLPVSLSPLAASRLLARSCHPDGRIHRRVVQGAFLMNMFGYSIRARRS